LRIVVNRVSIRLASRNKQFRAIALSRLEALRRAVSKTVMPIDSSKFFDSIRIKPNKLSAKQQARVRDESFLCECPEC
jgi:hypothetical protein